MDLPRSLRVSRDGEEPRYVVAVDVTDGPRVRFTGPVCQEIAEDVAKIVRWRLVARLRPQWLAGRIVPGGAC
jgi:hypothetical protein